MQLDGPPVGPLIGPPGPSQPAHPSASRGIGGIWPARISWATAVTGLEAERALSRSHSEAVASSIAWRTSRAPLARSSSTRAASVSCSWAARQPVTWAWAADGSRLATTPHRPAGR